MPKSKHQNAVLFGGGDKNLYPEFVLQGQPAQQIDLVPVKVDQLQTKMPVSQSHQLASSKRLVFQKPVD